MDDSVFAHRFRIPLGDDTRRRRTILIGLAAVQFVTLRIGIEPSRMSLLGVDFKGATPQMVHWMLAVAAGYFLLGFSISLARDLLASRAAAYRLEMQKHEEKSKETSPVTMRPEIPYYESRLRDIRFRLLWLARLAFECAFPLGFGLWTVLGR